MAAASAGVVVGEMAALEDLQKEVHVAIRERGFSRASRERCIERVKRCLDAVPAHVERIWPDHDTQSRPSAMCQAIRQKAFDVYCLLLSRGCQFKNARERMKCFDDVGPIQKSELQYQLTRFARRNQDAHVDYLKSRSFSVPPHDGFTEEVDSLYRELDGDALIRTVLQVAATSGYLRIFFDFAREDVQCMAALRNEQTYGLTDPERHTIYIAANRNRGDVLGTLAHELCHLAVSLAYENGGKPYRSDDRQGREHYQSVLEETMGRNPEEIILRDAFESEKSEEELIVRVPHVLAKYGHGGVNRLNENAPSLFQHFKSVFIPDMENYLIRFRGEIDDKKTSHTNAKLGKACKTDDLGVTFTEVPSQEELVDVPLLVLTAPNLTLLEVMVHDLLKATKLSYLFLEAQKWNDAVETLLSKDKCDVVLLSNPSNAVPEDSCDRMADILSELSETRGTRVIHLTTNEQMDLVAKTLRRQSFLSINTVSHEQRKACFLNVAEDCKRNVLRRSWINFQGSRERLSKWEETDLNSLLSAMDEDTFMALCQSNELNVGPQLRRDTEGYYVTRTCQRWSSYKETHLMETNEKIIAVTGAPGMGKTRLASRIAKMIKESGNREWVLHVDLPKVSKKLKALNAEDACGDLENFAEVCGVKKAGFEFALFKKTIREGSPFKVVLILDAVDEMCEDDRKKLLRFLHLLVLVRKEVSKVFVFSRSVFKDELREALSSEPYELLPFTVQEQETFLKQYKERTTQGPVTHQEPSAVHRLQDVWRLLKDDETLLGIPFFLRMVAALDHGEVFDDIDSDVLRKVFESTGSERYLSIYELATEYRYLQHRKEKKKEDISRACVEDDDVILKGHFYSSHRALAMKAVFDKKLCEDLLHEDEKESMSLLNKVSKNLLKHGLLDGLRDDRPVFSPQSIAEFWAAERLFGKISSSGSDTLHRFVFSMYGQGSCKRVTGFFDSFGMKSNEFHFAVMNRNVSYLRNCARDQDRDKLERNQWHIAALHADEDTISVLSSTETRSLEEKDKLGVTPYDYVLQLHEWTRLHSICSQCSNGGVCIAPVNNSSPHFVERELKDLQQWLLREQRVYCPSRSSGKALFFHVESPVALKRLTSSCCHYCWQTERISRVLDETRHRVPYENDNHAVWTAVTKHVPHSIVDNTDRAACAHPGAKCQCWAVLMFVLPDPNRSGLYEVQRGLQFIHMWFGLSTGCRKSEKTASAQRSDTSPTDDEESSDKWIDNRTNIHKAIDERNVDGVKKCLQFAPHLKLWLHPSSDETALHRAVKKQRMSIYRLLREHGCIMRDEETADCCHETANVEAFTHRFYDDNTLQTLRSHTESRPETADNERRTDDFYHALQANDLLRPMLSVSGTSQRVNVILNYDMESIDTVEGALENPNHGFANLETETICVAAKRDKGEVLGTLSHEFGHLALQFVYRNGGKPYLLTDRERELLYDTILYNIRKNQDKMDSLLKDLPREHDKEELIAYVPHLLAQYGSPGGENILEKEAPELFDFFKNVVIPDMIAYTKNRFPTRDQARIEVENRRLRHADQTEDRQVKLKRDLDYRDLPDAPILILTAPHLTVLEIMAYNAVKSTEQTHLFFMSSQWNPRLQDVLLSNCCKCVLITCDQDADIQNMLELLIELNEVAGTKVILLAQEDNVKNMVRRLEGHPFLANVHKVMNVSCAHLDTVKEDTKREILRTSRICFQGSPRLLSLEDLLDLDDDVQIPDEVTSLLSCQAKTIDIGMPVPRLDQPLMRPLHSVEIKSQKFDVSCLLDSIFIIFTSYRSLTV
ncbi:uncharacterized protein LOC135386295 isoform X2 [Ornithodoros turicata]|uniref:uncharacterized protein LOC135386295 isoform X2 n=1 Tax=Ornithodoros turicata TaxID=34597 RepID=UPI003138F986